MIDQKKVDTILRHLFILIFYFCALASSSSMIDSSFLNRLNNNIHNFSSFVTFYTRLLKEVRHHRPIDIVRSSINLLLIQVNGYNETHLNTSVSFSRSYPLFKQKMVLSILVLWTWFRSTPRP
jgi:hypothetical protein